MVTRYAGLDGASVIVTGAARGLGRTLAAAFAEQGSRLALVDIDSDGLTQTAEELSCPADRLTLIRADLSDVAELESIVDRTVQAFGRLDVLVNNAAVMDGVPLEEVSQQLFDRVIAVNLRAPLFLSRAALTAMRSHGGGRIINVGSVAARTGGLLPTVFCYAASKSGLLALTRSFARLGASDNVLVNAILPANIDSPMFWGPFAAASVQKILDAVPLARPAQTSEVAELVLWLASASSSYVTGASWDVNGGMYTS